MTEGTKSVYLNLTQGDFDKLTQIATQNNITLGDALSLLIARGYEAIQTEDDSESRYTTDKDYLIGTLASVGTSALWISKELEILQNRLRKAENEVSTLELRQQQEEG